MKTTSLSRFARLGLCLFAAAFSSLVRAESASAQATRSTVASPGFRMQTGSDEGDFSLNEGDYFHSSSGDFFSSSGDSFFSVDSGSNYFNDPRDENNAFMDEENIDPNSFTWSDDPRDPFASRTADDLRQYPLYKGNNSSFSFVKMSDGKIEKPSGMRSFAPPSAESRITPKFAYVHLGSLPDPRSHPISGDIYRDNFGNVTCLYGWPAEKKVVRVYFAGDVGEVRNGLVRRVFIECMKQWCDATRGKLKFTTIEDSRQADIILCREFTSNHELAENNPTFHNAWLDRVKIRLLDSTCDTLGEAQLRAVLLHSAGHSIGYFKHSSDLNSAMYIQCAHISNPTQRLCPCDSHYINRMYDSYKRNREEGLKKPVDEVVKIPWGQGIPLKVGYVQLDTPPKCPTRHIAGLKAVPFPGRSR